MLGQRLPPIARVGLERDAHARADVQVALVDAERRARGGHPFGVRAFADAGDRELVAAHAGDGVRRAHQLQQPLPEQPQHGIARRVPEGFVDWLEMVEVHQQQRQFTSY